MLLRHAPDRQLPQDAPDDAVAAITGEQRLHAMDFWLRNPDWLADELLDQADDAADDQPASDLRDTAGRIILDEMPDLRTYPMNRYKHGAWEPLDDSMGLLRTYGLATDVRRGDQHAGRRDFFLLPSGATAADGLVQDYPELRWYAERAQLVREVAGETLGTALKAHQKTKFEYRNADYNTHIPSIRERVMDRLATYGITA